MTRTRRAVFVRLPGGRVQQMTDGGSIDLDAEVVRGSTGERITEAAVAAMIEEIEVRPRRGRPSLSGQGTSAVVRARVPGQLRVALAARAQQEHRTESELLRDALEAYLARS